MFLISTGCIQQMITQLEKLGIENRKAFKPKELKEYYDKLESLKKSLIEKKSVHWFCKKHEGCTQRCGWQI